jgi:hypothetical protein
MYQSITNTQDTKGITWIWKKINMITKLISFTVALFEISLHDNFESDWAPVLRNVVVYSYCRERARAVSAGRECWPRPPTRPTSMYVRRTEQGDGVKGGSRFGC